MKNIRLENIRNNKLFSEKELHFDEYVDQLLRLQKDIAFIVTGNQSDENIRMDEIIALLQKKIRQKDLTSNSDIRKGIQALKSISKEIAICMSGKNTEERVAYALQFIERPEASTYRNIYLTDGTFFSEIDNLILTDRGLIAIEVKGTKKDVTISPDGLIFLGDDECYDKVSIGYKMSNKRNLLRYMIDEQLKEKDIQMDLHIDSYVVFSAPKGTRFDINDEFHQEKFCRQGKLQHIINEYESDVKYSPEEMEVLKSVLDNLETNQNGFEIKLDYKVLFLDFIEMMKVLGVEVESNSECISEKQEKVPINTSKREFMVMAGQAIIKGMMTGRVLGKVVVPVISTTVAFAGEFAKSKKVGCKV